MRQAPKVVALRALGLGDVLTSLPALRALARQFPGHHRVVLAPRALAPLLLWSGGADEVVDASDIGPIPNALRGADIAVNLHGCGPQSSAALAASDPRRLIAYRHPDVPATANGPVWDPDEHEVDRWCRLLTTEGIPSDPTDLGIDPPTAPLPRHDDPPTVVHPGASTGARRWTRDRWTEVVRRLERVGHHVVVTGDVTETALCASIIDAAGLPTERNLAGALDLLQLAGLIARARLVIVGDTGIAHLSTALRSPSVVLFGPEPPSRWGPRSGPHVVLWKGRTGDPRADEIDPGLAAIGVEEVVEHAVRISPASLPC